jgi:hypothetical protein
MLASLDHHCSHCATATCPAFEYKHCTHNGSISATRPDSTVHVWTNLDHRPEHNREVQKHEIASEPSPDPGSEPISTKFERDWLLFVNGKFFRLATWSRPTLDQSPDHTIAPRGHCVPIGLGDHGTDHLHSRV